MPTGGPIIELSWAGRTFKSAGDASVSLGLGGMNNAIEANGDPSVRVIQTRVPWSCEGAAINIDPDNGDQEFLQERSDSGVEEIFTVTLADNSVYQGKGTTTGDLKFDTSKATAAVNFGGGGTLTKQ